METTKPMTGTPDKFEAPNVQEEECYLCDSFVATKTDSEGNQTRYGSQVWMNKDEFEEHAPPGYYVHRVNPANRTFKGINADRDGYYYLIQTWS